MREILFRGKDIAGNWHFGVPLIFTKDYACITAPHTYNKSVVPETVGQYTGLTDCNGKKIFEGDIVKFCDIKGVINYNTGCFCIKTNRPDWKSRNNPAIDIVFAEYDNETEIIGNIHDNPELLKGGTDNDL